MGNLMATNLQNLPASRMRNCSSRNNRAKSLVHCIEFILINLQKIRSEYTCGVLDEDSWALNLYIHSRRQRKVCAQWDHTILRQNGCVDLTTAVLANANGRLGCDVLHTHPLY